MSASASSPLSCLIRHGSTLAKLRQGSNPRGNIINTNQIEKDNLYEKVGDLVEQLLEDLNRAQAPFVDESMVNIISKIEGLLREFVQVDTVHGEYYEKLSDKLKLFKSRWQQFSAVLEHMVSPIPGDSSNAHRPNSNFNLAGESDFTDNEKLCLLCFCLFPLNEGIKKRDLIYCWIGMDSISPGSDGGKAAGEQVLAKLVAKGLVNGPIRNNFCNRYKVEQAITDIMSLTVTEERSFSVISERLDDKSERPEPENIKALLNVREQTFDSTTFQWLSKMKNARVVHLGSWRGHIDSIVVEDIEVLKALKLLVEVRFLSLGGMSGIVHLPDSICKLEKLQVLDLRACNNLESLPTGIGSLQQLRHLDMSECYLLDHIPKAIASLSNLIVLKGFVIKKDPDSKVGSNTNRKSNRSSCALSDLSELKQLRKLSIRSRRMNFPTREDLQTLCQMQLNKLGIAWVGNAIDAQTDSDLENFPDTVEKLELHTAPKRAASRLLELISMQRGNRLEKLYIKGGGLREVDPMKHILAHVKVVRLRYLSKLDIDWDQFIKSFPKLNHLEIFECPNLAFFPCDGNGTWQR